MTNYRNEQISGFQELEMGRGGQNEGGCGNKKLT